MEALIESGDTGTTGQHLARLQRGDDLSQNATERFGTNVAGGSTPGQMQTAARLGYAVGGVSGAFQNRGSATRDDAGELVDVMKYVAPARVAQVAELGINALVGARVDSLNDLRGQFEDSTFPLDSANEPYGNEVLQSYENARVRAEQDARSA